MEAHMGSVTIQTNMLVPQDFNYVRRYTLHENNLLSELVDIFPDQITPVYENREDSYCDLPTGFYTFASVDVWIHNQSKQGFTSLYFKSREEYLKLTQTIQQLKASKI